MTTKHKNKAQMKGKTSFDDLVSLVDSKDLKPAENLTDIEAEMDKYIQRQKLAYVLEGEGKYYTWYEPTKEWMPLSWYKLRRDCPIVFANAETYLIHQAMVMARLKAAGRVYRSVRIKDLEFE